MSSEAEANQSSGIFASIASGITAVSGFFGGGGGSGGATKQKAPTPAQLMGWPARQTSTPTASTPKAPTPSQVSQAASIQGARKFPCCLTSAVVFLNTQKATLFCCLANVHILLLTSL